MRVLVTGVAGFLGSHLAEALVRRGDQVVGVDSLVGGDRENVPRGVDWYEGDCNDLRRLRRAMRAVDVVYHCAATAHEGLSNFQPNENAMNGYAASAAVFSAACDVRVRRIVFCSSMARYGKGERLPFTEDQRPAPEDPYGVGKYAAELLLENLCGTHGVEWAVVVPHNIYGPKQKYDDFARNVVSIFANLMLQGRQPFIYGDGKQERCFSYISDVVDPMVQMIDSPAAAGQVVNLGPDQGVVTILEVAERIARALDFPLDPVFVADRPREVKRAHCSADRARGLLGYEPKISLGRGIEQTVEWIRRKGPKPFSYHHLDIEIDSPLLPVTWAKRLL